MVSLLTVAASAQRDERRYALVEDAAEAEQHKPFLLSFIKHHLPYYWGEIGAAITSARPLLLEGQELGRRRLPAIEAGEFFLAIDLEANERRKIVVLTKDANPRLVGVVQISADQPSAQGAGGLSAADIRLTHVLSQNLR